LVGTGPRIDGDAALPRLRGDGIYADGLADRVAQSEEGADTVDVLMTVQFEPGITALILLVPSIVFMLLIERFLNTEMLAKVG
jgi:hypothetical protein